MINKLSRGGFALCTRDSDDLYSLRGIAVNGVRKLCQSYSRVIENQHLRVVGKLNFTLDGKISASIFISGSCKIVTVEFRSRNANEKTVFVGSSRIGRDLFYIDFSFYLIFGTVISR